VPINRDRVRHFNQQSAFQQIGVAPSRWVDREMGYEYVNRANQDDCVFIPSHGQSSPTRYAYRIRPLLGLLAKVRPDILHCEVEPYSVAAWQMMVVSRLLKIPLVLGTLQNHITRIRETFSRLPILMAETVIAGTDQIGGVWPAICQ
jgi:hypothetical protein